MDAEILYCNIALVKGAKEIKQEKEIGEKPRDVLWGFYLCGGNLSLWNGRKDRKRVYSCRRENLSYDK